VPSEIETVIEVLEADCDGLKHLNHVHAVEYLERARDDWYAACGLPAELGAVVVNIDYNYRCECFLGEQLRVMTRVQGMGRKSFVLAHEIVKPDETVAIDGKATSVIMDRASRFIIPVPECLANHLPQTP
jgi:YbgC/YbaW family acyl-CoA thioester hydrolase